LEQLTVNDNGSLIYYDDNGRPIHEPSILTGQQKNFKNQIQVATMDFIKKYGPFFFNFAKQYHPTDRETIGLIARFTLQPRANEIDLYKEFNHDINNGTKRMRMISNPSVSRELLIQGGAITYD
jgi:hypothetical protein